MKKYFIILVFLATGNYAQSQVLITLLLGDKLNSEGLEFGLEGDVSFSSIGSMETTNRLTGFNLGFYFDIRLNDPWYFYTGVLVKSRLGVEQLTDDDLDFLQADVYPEEGDYIQKLGYFIVPVLIKYKFESRFYLEAGPQLALLHKAWVEYQSEVDDREARIREDNRDMMNRIDAGVTGGVGYQLRPKGMTIGVKYYYGFANVYKDRSGTNNDSFYIKMTLPIGAKAQEKTDE